MWKRCNQHHHGARRLFKSRERDSIASRRILPYNTTDCCEWAVAVVVAIAAAAVERRPERPHPFDGVSYSSPIDVAAVDAVAAASVDVEIISPGYFRGDVDGIAVAVDGDVVGSWLDRTKAEFRRLRTSRSPEAPRPKRKKTALSNMSPPLEEAGDGDDDAPSCLDLRSAGNVGDDDAGASAVVDFVDVDGDDWSLGVVVAVVVASDSVVGAFAADTR